MFMTYKMPHHILRIDNYFLHLTHPFLFVSWYNRMGCVIVQATLSTCSPNLIILTFFLGFFSMLYPLNVLIFNMSLYLLALKSALDYT